MTEHTPPTNPNSLTYKWLVTILLVVLIAAGSAWISNVQVQVSKIPVLESQYETLADQLEKANDKLDAISGALRIPIVSQ